MVPRQCQRNNASGLAAECELQVLFNKQLGLIMGFVDGPSGAARSLLLAIFRYDFEALPDRIPSPRGSCRLRARVFSCLRPERCSRWTDFIGAKASGHHISAREVAVTNGEPDPNRGRTAPVEHPLINSNDLGDRRKTRRRVARLVMQRQSDVADSRPREADDDRNPSGVDLDRIDRRVGLIRGATGILYGDFG